MGPAWRLGLCEQVRQTGCTATVQLLSHRGWLHPQPVTALACSPGGLLGNQVLRPTVSATLLAPALQHHRV